ncbi:hypothetical protein HaLaN_32125, partial [Haematococcus lacustris]
AIKANGARGSACATAARQQHAHMSAAAATEAELDEAISQQPSVSTGYVSTCWGHKRPRSCLGRVAQQQLSMDQQQLQGAQHQLAVDQQQLQVAQQQLA